MNIQELNEKRKELGLTYGDLSERSGVPLGTIQKILGGFTRSPRMQTVEALEAALKEAERGGVGADGHGTAGSTAPTPHPGRKPAYDRNMVKRGWKMRETPGEYICGSSPQKGYADSYPGLPYKRQGEYTAADRELLPPDVRTELIDGVIYDMAAPAAAHQLVEGELHGQLRECMKKHHEHDEYLLFPAPSDVWLDRHDKTIVQPDLYVVDNYDQVDLYGHTTGAPVFVIEILSPSTAPRDRGLKLMKYQAAGVGEYWIVDLYKERVYVYDFGRAEEDLFDPEVYTFEDAVPVGISGGACGVDFRPVRHMLARLRRGPALLCRPSQIE